MTWRWRSFFVRFSSLPNSTLFWRQWGNNQQGDDANNNGAPRRSAAPGVRDPAAKQSRKRERGRRGEERRGEERRGARQEEFSSAAPTGGDERSAYMQQPPGGPVSSAQSVTLEPVGSCEDALTLLSASLQPLCCTSNELMSCLCMSFIRLCVAVWICFQCTRSDRAWG